MTIQGSSITAEEVFRRILEFREEDYGGSPAIPTNSVDSVGDKLTWTMPDFPYSLGQAAFDVKVDKLDATNRFVSVVTLGGHPLSGFRFWRVIATSGQSRDFTVETGAVEHNTTSGDWFKANVGFGIDNGNNGVLRTWESLFQSIWR